MVRRRLTVRRLDPWSVLKFGAIANLALLAIGLLVAGVVWFVIDRLALVDQACSIALDVGFTECGINAGNLFRALILLGLLWVVVQTAVLVFLSFLHNLIADLTGGLTVTVIDDTPGAAARGEASARRVTSATTPPQHDGRDRDEVATNRHRGTGRPPVEPLRRDGDDTTRPHRPVTSAEAARSDRGASRDDEDLFRS